MTDNQISSARIGTISASSIRAAWMGGFNIDDLSPAARYQYDLFGRRMNAVKQFDQLFEQQHPWISRIKGWPVIWSWYWRKRLNYMIERAGE